MAPAKLTAAVVVPKIALKTEPVSGRLVRSLPHPDRSAGLSLVAFNPQGQLIVAGYPSGVVQVLEPTSGKEIRTIETPRGYRGSSSHIQLSKDRRTLFVALDDSKFEPLRAGDRKTWFRRYSGSIRIWDLGTGREKEPLQVEPRRGVISLAVSPDGTRIATMEYTSGLSEDFGKLRAMYLWNVTTRKVVKLRDGYGDPRFGADGKTVFVTVNDYTRKTGVVHAYSADTGKEVGTLASSEGLWPALAFSPDGKYAAAANIDAKTKRPMVRLYDPARLQPRAALEAPEGNRDTPFAHVTFSPGGRRLAATAGKTVYLWDVSTRKLLKSWPLDIPGRVWHLVFDPAGRRLAASTWFIPPELQNARDEVVTPQDYPQPKVFLIDPGADRPEVIVCPHGWWGRLAFSPDGHLLAVGGAGATHVFDVRKKVAGAAEASPADEPRAKSASLEKAAAFLDTIALKWTTERKCATCHTNVPYLMARPALGEKPSEAEKAVRRFFEDRADNWSRGNKDPRMRSPAYVVATAVALATHDAATTGKLHASTRKLLDHLWTLQQPDGAWNWIKCNWPPLEHDDYYGAVLAAVGVGLAPDDYAKSKGARAGLEKLRGYLRKNEAPSLHHRAFLLWASLRIEGLMTKEQRERTIKDLLALQKADGGWSLASLGAWEGHDGRDNDTAAPSDGYGTGVVVYILRQAGLPAGHAAVKKGAGWLRSNQRVSGQWFTRSLNSDRGHYISHAGTAYALLALKACE